MVVGTEHDKGAVTPLESPLMGIRGGLLLWARWRRAPRTHAARCSRQEAKAATAHGWAGTRTPGRGAARSERKRCSAGVRAGRPSARVGPMALKLRLDLREGISPTGGNVR